MKWFSKQPTAKQENGPWAEQQALSYLQRQGLKLVERNYRCKLGEIDLIMTYLDKLIFVEVRFRRNKKFGSALESVDYRKQVKIVKTAQHYLQKNRLSERCQCRFDVVGVGFDHQGSCQITWIENAFQAF